VVTVLWSHTNGLSVVHLKELFNSIDGIASGSDIVFVSLTQNATSAILSYCLGLICSQYGITSMGSRGSYTPDIEYISVAHLIGNMTMNWLILMTGGSMTLILKLAEPLATMILSYMLLNKPASLLSVVFVLITIVGVMTLYKSKSVQSESPGTLFYPMIMGATVSCFPLRNVLSKRIEVSGLYLYCYLSAISTLVLTILFICMCILQIVNYNTLYIMLSKRELVEASFYFAMYNILSYVLLSLVDAVSHSVLGIAKRFYTICMSLYYLHDMQLFTVDGVWGVILALGGLVGYTYMKLASSSMELLLPWSVLMTYNKYFIRVLAVCMIVMLVWTCDPNLYPNPNPDSHTIHTADTTSVTNIDSNPSFRAQNTN